MIIQDHDDINKGMITLSSFDIAELTGGTWEGLNKDLRFSGVSIDSSKVSAGELYFPLYKKYYSSSHLTSLRATGILGIVVSRSEKIDFKPLPFALLRVDDPKSALRIIGEENAKRAKAKRILVTGTEGKTGLKIMLDHIVSQQIPCHAIHSSANLNVPIWRSMASIRCEDEIAIIEVSVANPKRGWQRSNIIRPHLCVITNISQQHMVYHGSIDRLIRHKAESVTALQSGGVCIINADNDYFIELKDAIQQIKPIPVLSFGSKPFCEGNLLNATFVPDKFGWQVQAKIFGKLVNYFVSMINSYAPLVSVSALTIAVYQGLDLIQASGSLNSFFPFETAGRIVKFPIKGGEFTLFDHSLRGSLTGFRSAFDDLYRVIGRKKVRLVLGALLDLGKQSESQHREMSTLIDLERTEKIYTVGDEMRMMREVIGDKSLLGPHGSTPEEIAEELFKDIQPGDIVFMKGHHRVWLSRLVKAMETRFATNNDKKNIKFLPKRTVSPSNESIKSMSKTEGQVFSLIAGGDVMLSRDLPGRVASAGIKSPFSEIRPLFEQADIVLVNLECVLSCCGDFFDKGERRPFYYRSPPHMVNVLVEGGVSAVTVANNHAMDYGSEALADQAGILHETCIAHAGSGENIDKAMQPMFIRLEKLIIAILSFGVDMPRYAAGENCWGIFETGVNKGTAELMKLHIDSARKNADLVIASPHWGENWKETPTEKIRKLGWSLIELGVDAVMGHSAHILQGVEVYHGKPIIYDMGTLLFDRVQENRMRNSALFELIFGTHGIERLIIHPVELEPGTVRSANDDESYKTRELMKALSRKLDPSVDFKTVGKTLELQIKPSSLIRRTQEPQKTFIRSDIRLLKSGRDRLSKANIFLPTPPSDFYPNNSVDLGGGLLVLGSKFPEQVHPNYGFVLEVFFRFPAPGKKRWRATVMGINSKTGEKFRYRHPVSDGMWVPQNWNDEKIIKDRIVVRPQPNLPLGKYELYWNLVNADTRRLRSTEVDHPLVKDNWLSIGSITLTKDAPRVVAGITLQKERIMLNNVTSSGISNPNKLLIESIIAEGANSYSDSSFLYVKRNLSIELIVKSAKSKGMKVVFHQPNIYELIGHGKSVVFSQNAPENSHVAKVITPNKNFTKNILTQNGLPVPQGGIYGNYNDAVQYFLERSIPQVIKPKFGTHGSGVTTNITNLSELKKAWKLAKKSNQSVIIEDYISGDDLRVLIVGGKAQAAYVRVPAHVIGTGVDNIETLVKEKNKIRSKNPRFKLSLIKRFDLLEANGLNFSFIPAVGEKVQLTSVSNISTGGESVEILDSIHPSILEIAEKSVQTIPGLNIAGVDLIVENFTAPTSSDNTVKILEINSNPSIADPVFPMYGKPVDLPGIMIDYFLENEKIGRKIENSAKKTPAINYPKYISSCNGLAFSSTYKTQMDIIKQAGYKNNLLITQISKYVFTLSGKNNEVTFFQGIPDRTINISRMASNNKNWTKCLLNASYIRTPHGEAFTTDERENAWLYTQKMGKPVVVKPQSGSGGSGVSVNISSQRHFDLAWNLACSTKNKTILVEEYFPGNDYRLFVIDNQVAAVMLRIPAYLVGDGIHTVQQLVDEKNLHRLPNPHLGAKLIKITPMIKFNLAQQGITETTILKIKQRIELHSIANIGSGGESVDVSETMHPGFIDIAVRARKAVFGPVHAGIDLLAEDISKSPDEQDWMVIEVNVNPDIALHHFPSSGTPRDAAGALVSYLFPEISTDKMNPKKSIRVLIKGKVQKIGFRKWLWRNAHLHAISGWIQNNPDGTIESIFYGAPNAVDHLLNMCRKGPKNAVVTEITSFPYEKDVSFGFFINKTATKKD